MKTLGSVYSKVYRRAIPATLRRTPSLLEIPLLIISEDLVRFPGNGKCFEDTREKRTLEFLHATV